ncbi:hemicentin-2-like [Sycon ciliatum]|uniref:hemicentin-2-like n=1 Tax=Sycon ciliatum TaxID=27933 RepID=UPI0031F6D7E2
MKVHSRRAGNMGLAARKYSLLLATLLMLPLLGSVVDAASCSSMGVPMLRSLGSTATGPGSQPAGIQADKNITVINNSSSAASISTPRCLVQVATHVTISELFTWWLFNGVPIESLRAHYSITASLYQDTVDGVQRLFASTAITWPDTITESQQGVYSCRVCNESESFFLNVVVPARILFVNSSTALLAGSSATLLCTAEGESPVHMSWYRDGAEIMSATSHSLQLVLDNVSAQHRGTYRCVASNLYGNESRDLVIFVQEVPVLRAGSTPALISSALTSTSANFSLPDVASNGNATVIHYSITCTPTSMYAYAKARTAVATSQTVTVSGLHPGVEYMCAYRVLNAVGHSRLSSPLRICTAESISDPPTSLEIASVSPLTIDFQFQAPAENSSFGVISGYRVYYCESAGCNNTADCPCLPKNYLGNQTITNTGSTQMRGVIMDLKADTTYTLLVQAINAAGYGRPASVLGTTNSNAIVSNVRKGKSSTNLALIIPLCILALVLIVGTAILWRMRHRMPCHRKRYKLQAIPAHKPPGTGNAKQNNPMLKSAMKMVAEPLPRPVSRTPPYSQMEDYDNSTLCRPLGITV